MDLLGESIQPLAVRGDSLGYEPRIATEVLRHNVEVLARLRAEFVDQVSEFCVVHNVDDTS